MRTATREDYELAAKAAGIDIFDIDRSNLIIKSKTQSCIRWNPLHDDGDSRRLQIAIDADLQTRTPACLAAVASNTLPKIHYYKDHNGDKCEAARHAVFWLAVEIGRAM
jgi:hypothetical protein